MRTGLIFNLQKYSIHDGPGIRTTVFLRGCPLDCWWCHNPESQTSDPQITVVEARCAACGECWEVCPQRDFDPERRLPHVDHERCLRCGQCVTVCPTAARQLVGRRMSVAEVLAEILQDRLFYDESGGGVTVSGGEPLLQLDFVSELLAACRAEGVHTALDTCGFARQDDLLAIARLTDLFLYDVKLLDDARHRQYTGVSNAVILQNLRALSAVHDQIWIRVPIIPGVNDDTENLDATARFVAELRGVRQVTLLPYHKLGVHKAARLGRSPRLGPVDAPSAAYLDHLAERFRHLGLDVRAGAPAADHATPASSR
jgi:pyruvate formate lyase activating enzyme